MESPHTHTHTVQGGGRSDGGGGRNYGGVEVGGGKDGVVEIGEGAGARMGWWRLAAEQRR